MINVQERSNDPPKHDGRYRHLIMVLGLAGLFFAAWYLFSGRLQTDAGALAAYLPYPLLLLCPLMHVFMHHGHGSGKKGDNSHDDHQPDK